MTRAREDESPGSPPVVIPAAVGAAGGQGGIVAFASRHRRAILFSISLVILWGVYEAFRLPVALFPAVTFPRLVILADNGEQPIERTMLEVTRPLEEAARGVPGVRVVRSATSRGSSEISVNLDWNTNLDRAMQFLQGRIASVRGEMPSTTEVQVERMDVSVFPMLGFSLTSKELSAVDLRELALYTLRPELLRIPGIARVDVAGGETREFQVIVDPTALAAHGLDLRDVSEAIQASNLTGANGLVTDNYRLYLSFTDNLLTGLEDIRNVVVTSREGVLVSVRDVAEVRSGVEDRVTRISSHGQDAVLLDITRQPDGNTVEIGREVKALLASMGGRIPPQVKIEPYMDQSEFIQDAIGGTRDAILFGVALAMGILLLFLRSARITLVAAIVVPATVACTIGCLGAIGQTINIMTLGGIAAAVGLIVDDVIVIVENIFRHQHTWGGRFQSSAQAAVGEIFPAILGSTLATLVIHIPFAFLGGVTGAFFSALSITMVFALSLSFVLSVVFAPLVVSGFMPAESLPSEKLQREARGSRFQRLYEGSLRFLLRRKWIVAPALVGLLLGGVGLYLEVGSGFMPDMDEGTFVLDYVSPPGTSFDETGRMLRSVEHILATTPEVQNYGRRTGTELGFFVTEPNDGDILVKLKRDRQRSIFAVIDEIRRRVESAQPALKVEFGQQMQDVIGDLINNPSPIEIKVFGEDKAQIEETAHRVADLITPIRGVEDVFDGIVVSGPGIAIQVDRARAGKLGLTVADVQGQLENAILGRAETRVLRGERLIGIRTREKDQVRQDLSALRGLEVRTAAGFQVPLETVAKIATTGGQSEIERENLKPVVSVTARISGRDLGSTVSEIRRTLREKLALPRGVTLAYGGTYRTQQESFRGLVMVLALAILFVMVVLLFEFESFRVPLCVFLINLPSLFGVALALWLTGVSFNVSSFVGTILVVGIVAENAIFVLHYVMRGTREGMALDEALVQASLVRVRPILMTTFAAVFALMPLALGHGMQQPLAIAVIGGFSVSTLLLLFALPMLFGLMHRPGKV